MDCLSIIIETFKNSALVSFLVGVCLLVFAVQVMADTDFKSVYKFKVKSIGSLIIVWLWIVFFLGMPFVKKTISELTLKTEFERMICMIILSALGMICYKKNICKHSIKKCIDYFADNKGMLVGLVIISIAVLFKLNTAPLYDANVYYGQIVRGIKNYNYTLQGFLNSFMVWGKLFHPIAPLLVIGEMIFPGTAKGIYIINLLLLLGAVICVYEILKEDFPQLTKNQCALIGLIFAFFPYVLVGTIYINPDFYCAVFFVYFVYFYKTNNTCLLLYFALVFICCKKNMIVTYGLFLMCVEFRKLMQAKSIKNYLKNEPILFYFLPVQLMAFLLGASVKTTESMPVGVNTFWEKTINRFLQGFVFGLKWMIWIGIIICVGLWIKRYGFKCLCTKIKECYWYELSIVLASFSQFIIYIICWKKMSLSARYFAQNVFAYTILITVIVVYLKKRTYTQIVDGVIMLWLLLYSIENYSTIDPSFLICAAPIRFDRGNVYIECSDYKSEPIGIGDLSSYNFEYTIWDNIFQDVLRENSSDYHDDILFFAALDNEHLLGCDDYRFGVTYKELYDVYWDDMKQCISYINNGESTHKISIESISMDNFGEYKGKLLNMKEIVLLEPDGINSTVCSQIENLGYEIVFNKIYSNSKTQINYVKMKRVDTE